MYVRVYMCVECYWKGTQEIIFSYCLRGRKIWLSIWSGRRFIFNSFLYKCVIIYILYSEKKYLQVFIVSEEFPKKNLPKSVMTDNNSLTFLTSKDG